MTASEVSSSHSFPFDFSPRAVQDTEVLQQLQFVPGLKELLTVRQVHALEHATVWVLSELGRSPLASSSAQSPSAQSPSARLTEQLGGMSTERGFYLYGAVDPVTVEWAVHRALQRLVAGEWDLAVHPRCGTNLSVGILLTAGLAIGVNWLLPKDPLGQLLGLGLAATAAAGLAPDFGSLAQRYLTTAIPFNLAVQGVTASRDRLGHPVHFVQVQWVESIQSAAARPSYS
jgi:Domain of unknown function (DUF6391)